MFDVFVSMHLCHVLNDITLFLFAYHYFIHIAIAADVTELFNFLTFNFSSVWVVMASRILAYEGSIVSGL